MAVEKLTETKVVAHRAFKPKLGKKEVKVNNRSAWPAILEETREVSDGNGGTKEVSFEEFLRINNNNNRGGT